MSRHKLLQLGGGVVAAAGLLLLAACQEHATQPSSALTPLVPSNITLPVACQVGRIGTLAYALLPARSEDFDLRQSVSIVLTLSPTQLPIAQALARQLAAALADPRILALLQNPVLVPPESKGAAISELVNLVFGCVQLAPPGDLSGAYSPGGGVKVIGTSGGTLVTNDNAAVIQVPANAITGDHVFAISPNSALALAHQCLPGNPVGTYNQCYNFTVTPAQTAPFVVPVRIAMCTLNTGTGNPSTPTSDVHDRLRIAAPDHYDPTKIIVYDRKPVPAGVVLNCTKLVVAANKPSSNGMLGSMWTRVASIMEKVTAPFSPKLAYALDGVGGDVPLLTPHTTIDPLVYQTGFESTDAAWTTSGFWHTSALVPDSNKAYPQLVSLASLGNGDLSKGRLPAPFSGAGSLWYGEEGTGNYGGVLLPEYAGGTSQAPNSGIARSPSITVPNTVNAVKLTFQSWFEIESRNSDAYDLMTVNVEDGETSTLLAKLNPTVNPGGPAKVPFTSGGFDLAPVWVPVTVDLSAFKGKTVRLRLNFNTGDNLYNGFRGWIVDDVKVAIQSQTPSASTTRISLPPTVNGNSLDAAAASARVWQP